jgi:hypothetical protein
MGQEENLKWASELLGVEYDKGAKDITRVFFTTTEQELVFLDDAIFEVNLSTDFAASIEDTAGCKKKETLRTFG